MNLNPQQFPSELFNLIQTKAFDELDLEKQQWTLMYLTEEEYQAMHIANSLTSIHSGLQKQEQNIKANLLLKLENLSPNQKIERKAFYSYFWQAASVLLLMSTAWFGYRSLTPNVRLETKTVVSRDTIYIEKESKKVHDEIAPKATKSISRTTKSYLQKTSGSTVNSSTSVKTKNDSPKPIYNTSEQGLPVLSLDKLNDASNSPKRNSKRYEPLEDQFRYVSL